MRRAPSIAVGAVLHTGQRGAAVVEFALILPLLILLMVGLFDFGVGFWQYMQVQAAAEAGAQYATLHPDDTAGIAAAVASATGTSGISATPLPAKVCGCPGNHPFEVACGAANCDSGSKPGVYAKVSAQVGYSPLLPYPSLPPTLSGHAYRRLN